MEVFFKRYGARQGYPELLLLKIIRSLRLGFVIIQELNKEYKNWKVKIQALSTADKGFF